MKARHYIFSILLVTLLCVGAYFLVPPYLKYQQVQRRENQIRRSLGEARLQRIKLKRDIHQLKTDPEAVERVAREKFGWSKDNEHIYRFEDAPESNN
ncbi:MAG: FtsB family cell division protein [Verrucomicrobiota bacterium]